MDSLPQCLWVFLIITKIFLIMRLSTYLKKVSYFVLVLFKSCFFDFVGLIIFDLINYLYNLSLIFIECLIPLVTQGFYLFSLGRHVCQEFCQWALEIFQSLKLVPTIFHQIFISSPNDSPSKTMKSVFYLF